MGELSEYYKIYYGQNKTRINAKRRQKYREEQARRKDELSEAAYRQKGSYSREYRLWYAAKIRSNKYEIPFNIEISDIKIPEFCPILGIKLDTDYSDKTKQSSPSLDKIHPKLGYIRGNIAVVSFKANRMKSDLDLWTLNRILRYINKTPDLIKIQESQKELKEKQKLEDRAWKETELPGKPELYESDLFKVWKETLLETLEG